MRFSNRLLAAPLCLAFLLASAIAQADSVCFLTVLKLRDSGYPFQQNLVISNSDDWRTIWEQIFSNTSEKPPVPEIDFTRRTLVCVFQGTQPTTGFEILIQEITETDTSLEVAVKTFEPGGRCGVLNKLTRPLNIVEVEKTAKQVVFQVKNKIRKCQ
jgi:hypothetical protein